MTADPVSLEDSITDASPHDEAGTLSELFRVAAPLIVSYGSLSLMGVIDRIYLTWLGVDALAASMPAGMLHWTVLSIPFGIATYTNTFVGQYEGAGQKERVAACVWQGLWLAGVGGIALIGLLPVVRQLMFLMDHQPEVQRLELQYFTVMALGSTPMLTTAVLSAFFNGRGRTWVVMWVNLVATLVNALLDPFLIFGWGLFPRWGIAGAALATVGANAVSTILLALLVHKEARREGYPFAAQCRWTNDLVRRMLRYGFPNGIQFVVDVGAYMLFIVFTGRLGTEQLAATNLAFNLNSMAFVPMIGLGLAVMTLVGRRIGAGQPDLAARTTWLAFWFSAIYMGVFGILYLGVPDLLLIPYSIFATEMVENPAESFEVIHPTVVKLLRFVAAYSFFDAMAIVFGNAGRGAGDVKFSLWFIGLVSWLVMVLPCYLLVTYTNTGIYGTWGVATASIIILGVGFLWRFEAGHWRSMRVIEDELVGNG